VLSSSAHLRINNEVAGFTFATIGVLYPVRLAFTVIAAWQNFIEPKHTAAQEAGAAATLYRLPPCSGVIRVPPPLSLARYIQTAVEQDWLVMERRRSSLTPPPE
jgi:hypothetical protein